MSKQKRAEAVQAKRAELQEQVKALKEKAFFAESPKLLDRIAKHEAKLSALDTEAQALEAEVRAIETEKGKKEQAKSERADRELRARLPGEARKWIEAEGRASANLYEAFGVLQGLVEHAQALEDAGSDARNRYWTSLNALSSTHPELPGDLDELRRSPLIRNMETEAGKKAGLPIPQRAAESQRFRFFREALRSLWWQWRRELYPEAADRPKTTIKM